MVPRIPVERVVQVKGKGPHVTLADAGVLLAMSGQRVLRAAQNQELDLHVLPAGRLRYLVGLDSITQYLDRIAGAR